MKGPYRWQGQKTEMTSKEIKEMKEAQQQIKDIYKKMEVDVHSMLNKYIIKKNPMKHDQILPSDEESDADKSSDIVATEGSSSTSTSSHIDSYKKSKNKLCEAWYTLPESLGSEDINM